MGARISGAVNVLLAACAIVLTALMVRREFGPSAGQPASTALRKPRRIQDWKDLEATGLVLGKRNAPIRLIEFTDFQCPACAQFALGGVPMLQDSLGDSIAIIVHHWPLAYHTFARPAAIGAECAAAQGSFEKYHEAVFARQSLLMQQPVEYFAKLAGVPDIEVFRTCMSDPATAERVDRSIARAREIDGEGTPTFILDGLVLPVAPSLATLRESAKR